MVRSRELRVRETQTDALVADRQHQRLDQYYLGVRIAGGDLTRQLASDGTVSIFGMMHTRRRFERDAEAVRRRRAIGDQRRRRRPVVRPRRGARGVAAVRRLSPGVLRPGLNQSRHRERLHRCEFRSAVTTGTAISCPRSARAPGTYGDNKKVSTTSVAGSFIADDKLRPTEITTFDARGNFARAQALINGLIPSIADIATSSSNTWTDGTVVDAHAYAGLYYDYLFKRFGRHGLDNRDLRIDSVDAPGAPRRYRHGAVQRVGYSTTSTPSIRPPPAPTDKV